VGGNGELLIRLTPMDRLGLFRFRLQRSVSGFVTFVKAQTDRQIDRQTAYYRNTLVQL